MPLASGVALPLLSEMLAGVSVTAPTLSAFVAKPYAVPVLSTESSGMRLRSELAP